MRLIDGEEWRLRAFRRGFMAFRERYSSSSLSNLTFYSERTKKCYDFLYFALRFIVISQFVLVQSQIMNELNC